MSTIKVTNIKHASTANGGIQLDSAGHVTVDGQQMPTAGALSNRNLIINGAMNVAQRGATSTGVTTTGFYGPDRYRFITAAGTYTITRSTDNPVGFSRSWKVEVTTAASLTGLTPLLIQQRIEAQDLQHLNFGTANAVNLTLSFWVKSSKTGTVTVEPFRADTSERHICREVTINAANTWEHKTVSIPGDTVNLIDDDNGPGMDISWWLDAGADFKSGTLNTSGWAAKVNGNRVSSSNIALADTLGANFYLTGVQLEVGEKATPFEHRSYGDELARSMRYFQKQVYPLVICGMSASDQINKSNWFNYAVPMRAQPTTLTIRDNNGTAGNVHFQPLNTGGSNQGVTVQNSSEFGHNLRKDGTQTGSSQFIYAFEANAEL